LLYSTAVPFDSFLKIQ